MKPLLIRSIVLSIMTVVLYLVMWPTKVDPLAWEAPQNSGFTGSFAVNDKLKAIKKLPLGDGVGPEDVDVDAAGWVYGGLQDGRIVRFKGGDMEVFADTKGRPLGLAFYGDDLLVADSFKGLLRINPKGEIETLATEADGLAFGFTDDLDVTKDGVVFFTDASHKFNQHQYQDDGLEHQPNGRFLSYDLKSGEVEVLVKDLYFPNGVSVSHDGAFVLVTETWNYRVLKFWINGPKQGTWEPILENLPGFPDGISRGQSGIFWLALAAPRDNLLDMLAPWPFIRKILARLPKSLKPDAVPYACVLGIDAKGRVKYNLQDPNASSFGTITSVEEKDGRLWLGSLKERAIGYYDL